MAFYCPIPMTTKQLQACAWTRVDVANVDEAEN